MLPRFRIFVAFWLVLAMGACDPNSSAKSPRRQTEVRVGYFANVTHAQAVLGVTSGDYAKAIAPAKLSTKVFNAGPSLIEALLAGEIDVGYVGPGPVLSAHAKSKGQAVRIIAGAAANGVLIVARADSGISSLADLKNKRVIKTLADCIWLEVTFPTKSGRLPS